MLQPMNCRLNLQIPISANFFLSSVPVYFFLSGYLLVFFIWRRILRATMKMTPPRRYLHPLFYLLMASIGVILCILYIVDFSHPPPVKTTSIEEQIIIALLSILFIFFSIMFVYLFLRVQKVILRFAKNSSARNTFVKASNATLFLALCFFVRSGVALALFYIVPIDDPDFERTNWYVPVLYYFVLEIVPLIFMHVLLGELKQRKRIKEDKNEKNDSEQSKLLRDSDRTTQNYINNDNNSDTSTEDDATPQANEQNNNNESDNESNIPTTITTTTTTLETPEQTK